MKKPNYAKEHKLFLEYDEEQFFADVLFSIDVGC